ncbi:uncharacterized protein METZ01_LOCUS234891, partial [marine metagenome]
PAGKICPSGCHGSEGYIERLLPSGLEIVLSDGGSLGLFGFVPGTISRVPEHHNTCGQWIVSDRHSGIGVRYHICHFGCQWRCRGYCWLDGWIWHRSLLSSFPVAANGSAAHGFM